MRLYKHYYKDKQGGSRQTKNWYIELRDHKGKLQQFPAVTDQVQSLVFGKRIEDLVRCKAVGDLPDAKLTKWISEISPRLRDRLVKIGVLDTMTVSSTKPLQEHISDFVESRRARNCTQKHVGGCKTILEDMAAACGFVYWGDVTAHKVELYLAGLRNQGRLHPAGGKHRKGVSARTSNWYLSAVKIFCKWMVEDGRAPYSPVVPLNPLKWKADLRHQRRAYTVDELQRLIAATQKAPVRCKMSGPRRAFLYRFMAETGLRTREAGSLTPRSFDYEAGMVTVEAAVSKHRERDEVPMKTGTLAEIESLTKNMQPQEKIFPLATRPVWALKKDLQDAGLDYKDEDGRFLDMHSFRHTTGTLLAAQRVHPKTIQRIMRHKDINITMNLYTHLYDGQWADAVEKLPDFGPPESNKKKGIA